MGALCSTGVRPMKANQENAPPPKATKGLTYDPYPEDYDPPFPIEIVGTFSNHGIEPDMANNTIVKANQDRGSVDFPFAGNVRQALFCCLDGHGRDGDKVSQFAMENIHDIMETEEAKLALDPALAFKDAFEGTDEKLRNSSVNSHSSGTSVVAVYMLDDKLYIANCGDSRCVLGRKAVASAGAQQSYLAMDLSWDQKPDTTNGSLHGAPNGISEKERIELAGGIVTPPEAEGLSSRVWTRNGRYGLSMARSIGDHLLAKNGVIATPEVEQHTLVKGDEFLILATDGIWEFISSQEAVDIVGRHTNSTEACFELIQLATRLWEQFEGQYRDDITCIVIQIKACGEHMRKQASGLADLTSPTSKDLRTKRSAVFPGPRMNLDKGDGQSEELLPANLSPETGDSEKAKTFRKRRLSLNPMEDDVIEQARKQHQQEMAAQQPGMLQEEDGAPVPPQKERKRRLSISPDMDPTGAAIVPPGV